MFFVLYHQIIYNSSILHIYYCFHWNTLFFLLFLETQVVAGLSSHQQVDQNYFIVGGTRSGEGAVISRGRAKADDVWYLGRNATSNHDGWYRLQTNYDHWNPTPKADDRRTPGYLNMDKMGQEHVATDLFKDVVHVWPTFNHHTDYTVMMSASDGQYESMVWKDN